MPFVGADLVVEVVLKGLGFGLKCLKDWQVDVVLFLLVFVGHGFDEDGNNFADFDDVVFDFLHGCSICCIWWGSVRRGVRNRRCRMRLPCLVQR